MCNNYKVKDYLCGQNADKYKMKDYRIFPFIVHLRE